MKALLNAIALFAIVLGLTIAANEAAKRFFTAEELELTRELGTLALAVTILLLLVAKTSTTKKSGYTAQGYEAQTFLGDERNSPFKDIRDDDTANMRAARSDTE